MKLLIVTQVVDIEHPILGFFHRWVEEFALHCEHVHVICLQAGNHNFPENVTVHSLGKESGTSRLTYLLRFYKLIWQLRNEYDSVFVHMNQMYVILGALLWRACNKPVGLWYAHGAVTVSLRLAVLLTNKVFTSTEQGMRIATDKKCIVGQGIDPNQFNSIDRTTDKQLTLMTVGRVSVSKNIDTLLRAAAQLKKHNVSFHLEIVGGGGTEADGAYIQEMRELTTELSITDQIVWVGPLAHAALPTKLKQAHIFIHDGSTNSLDKTLVEASFAGCIVISSNPAYRSMTQHIAPELLFNPKDHQALANCIMKQIKSPSESAALVKQELLQSSNLRNLVSAIVEKSALLRVT